MEKRKRRWRVHCHDTLSQDTVQVLACQPTFQSGGASLVGELAAELILLVATAKTLWSTRGPLGAFWVLFVTF